MEDPLDAAPMDSAHYNDAREKNAEAGDASLRYKMLVRLLQTHDPDYKISPSAEEVLAEHIADMERRCADILKHLHPDEAAHFAPLLGQDLRPH